MISKVYSVVKIQSYRSKKIEFEGVTEVEIKNEGESIILTPKRKSWISFTNIEKADGDFLLERLDVVEDGRVKF